MFNEQVFCSGFEQYILLIYFKKKIMTNFNKWQALHLGMKLALAVIGACFLAHVDFDFTFSFFFLWKGLSNMKKKGR